MTTRSVATLLFVIPAMLGHTAPSGWVYPLTCCANQDCREVPASKVQSNALGYVVPSGEIIGYGDGRIKNSPDGEYHWCTFAGADDSGTVCLFVPPPGV